ncbi:MAG: hypothetical protein RJB56_570 [Actinomycetota bacterium]|jgi:hypothetical protein
MRFLISVIDSESNSGSSNEMAAIDAFNDKLSENGHWIFACGVAAPSTATTIDNRADAGITIAGPVNDTNEFQSGFWIIKADSRDQAEALAAEGSKACNRKVEVRALL